MFSPRIRRLLPTASLLCALGLPSLALAQQTGNESDGRWSTHAGAGFSLSPGGFAVAFGGEYEILTPGFGIGPLVQIAGDDDELIVAPTANARYRFDLSHLDSEVARNLHPFVQGGLGFGYVDRERRGRDRDDIEFLLDGGLGLEYDLGEHLSIGNAVLFNGFPADDAAGEEFFFTWQLATLRYRF